MESLKAALDAFVTRVTESAGLYTAVIGIFLYHVVFDKDFECTCDHQTRLCSSYMALPVFIILFMLLWLDRSFQALLKSCLKGTGRFRCFLWLWIFRAFFISLLWPISMMIDGDWYICCHHDKNLYCRNQTSEDQMTIKDLKNTSRLYGFSALLGIIFLAGCLRFPWKECCYTCQGLTECCTPCKECYSCCLSEDDLYKKIVCEEGENLVTKKLIEVAKSKIDETIDEYAAAGQWEKCFGVVDEIIGPPPNQNNPNHPPGGSPSASTPNDDVDEERVENPQQLNPPPDDDETEQVLQPLIHVSRSESPSNGDVGEAITDPPQNQNNPNHPPGGSSSASPPNDDVGEVITDPPQNQKNPDPPPGGSSSADERLNGSGDETEPLIQGSRSQ